MAFPRCHVESRSRRGGGALSHKLWSLSFYRTLQEPAATRATRWDHAHAMCTRDTTGGTDIGASPLNTPPCTDADLVV